MPTTRPFPIAAIAVLTLGGVASGQDGFDYCAPPVVPGCIEHAARTRRQADFRACGPHVLRFTQTLGAFRACLQRESEHTIATGNDAIARFRCLSLGHVLCGPARDETER